MKEQFILNFIPAFCPACGKETNIKNDKFSRSDFNSGCSFSCSCGVQYQRLDFEHVREKLEGLLDSYMLEE
jgi:hypothetical protein